jgi:hypothetical protein
MKQMPPAGSKSVEKDKSLVKEPFVMDVEAEVDRRLLCDKILTQIDIAQAKSAMSQTQPNLVSNFAAGSPIGNQEKTIGVPTDK